MHPDDDTIAALVTAARAAGEAPVAVIERAVTAGSFVDPVLGPGLLRAALLEPVDRRRGSVHTPVEVARRLVAVAVEAHAAAVVARTGAPPRWDHLRVVDPAVGGGVFAVAAVEALAARGVAPVQAVRCVRGFDVDLAAVAATRAALAAWAGVPAASLHGIRQGDALADGPAGCAAAGDAIRHAAGDPVRDAAGDPVRDAAGDAYVDAADDARGDAHGVDLVVGNPPFQSQLAAATARGAAEAERLRQRLGDAVVRYADTAAVFLVDAVARLRPDGVAALVAPLSVLSAGDAAPIRQALLDDADLVGLWVATERVFAADVPTCAPVLVRRGAPASAGASRRSPSGHRSALRSPELPRSPELSRSPVVSRPPVVARWRGPVFDPRPDAPAPDPSAATWAPLLADLLAVPAVSIGRAHQGVVGDVAQTTAGFRDQYYGLRSAVAEAAGRDDGRPRLVTSGLIDPARCRWGDTPTRFDRRRWAAPVVDLDVVAADAPAVAAWGGALLVPKLVVATQTRVIEAAVDRTGSWWPSVPTIAVVAPPEQLDRLLAVLLAPPVSAWAFGEAAGAALSTDALRLRASQVAAIPLPPPGAAWDAAASILAGAAASAAAAPTSASTDAGAIGRGELEDVGALMCEAYGVGDDVLRWWLDRLPTPR